MLSPYLRGGGAAAFNFQALSQDLLAATLEIPFSVPPYMSLLARRCVVAGIVTMCLSFTCDLRFNGDGRKAEGSLPVAAEYEFLVRGSRASRDAAVPQFVNRFATKRATYKARLPSPALWPPLMASRWSAFEDEVAHVSIHNCRT